MGCRFSGLMSIRFSPGSLHSTSGVRTATLLNSVRASRMSDRVTMGLKVFSVVFLLNPENSGIVISGRAISTQLLSAIPNPRLRGGVRDPYRRDGLKGN